MKTIVYIEDGSIEATVWADKHVADGIARYATPQECADYERHFARCDALANVPFVDISWIDDNDGCGPRKLSNQVRVF